MKFKVISDVTVEFGHNVDEDDVFHVVDQLWFDHPMTTADYFHYLRDDSLVAIVR